MASRLLRTIIERLTAPPLALKGHAVLVLTAAFALTDTRASWWWAGPAIVAILLWPLLRGSLFVWWVQLVGIGFAILGAATASGTVLDAPSGYSVFVDVPTFVLVAAALVVAWLLLLLPSVRAYCYTDPGRRPGLVMALGVWIVSSFPGVALSLEARVPSADVVERTPGAVFVGSDPRGPVAFYVAEDPSTTCLVALAPRHTSRSCSHGKDHGRDHLHEHASPIHVEDALVDAVPEEVERVQVLTSSGPRTATLLESDRAGVDLYYLLDAPSQEVVRVVGYDANDRAIYRAEGEDW